MFMKVHPIAKPICSHTVDYSLLYQTYTDCYNQPNLFFGDVRQGQTLISHDSAVISL